MNCKQGDLAIIVKSMAGNEGKIVTCLHLHPDGFPDKCLKMKNIWEIDTELPTVNNNGIPNGFFRFVPDAWLKPIKGLDELQDEELKELELIK